MGPNEIRMAIKKWLHSNVALIAFGREQHATTSGMICKFLLSNSNCFNLGPARESRNSFGSMCAVSRWQRGERGVMRKMQFTKRPFDGTNYDNSNCVAPVMRAVRFDETKDGKK